tara:strand:- start:45 stop:290 length:246 start_codon:yes stop_codon:yes gene_type:complete
LTYTLKRRAIDPPLFLYYNIWKMNTMDKERLKLIVRNLKSLVDALESEVYSDVNAYRNSDAFSSPETSYDEMYDDDDGYAD